MKTDQQVDTWAADQLAALYNAVLTRMVVTYCLNEMVKTGVKTPLKDGLIAQLRETQKQQNYLIIRTMQRIDRGTRD